MPGPYTPASAGLRPRANPNEPRRPIASALPLDHEHVHKIDESHERCLALGLSRIERLDFSPLGRSDLGVVRERNQRLYAHAAPVMEMLYEQIVNSESMVVLCDATGTIIHSIGDIDFVSRASKVALQPGVNWSEQSKGTNAVGTALIEESPTLVHADEHFMHANHFLTCSAAPILDPRGNILGVLDVSGDQRTYHQHTMGLVKMSARMIENHWLTDDYRNVMRLHFHSRVEFIGTLMEGILAVSQDGKLVGANRGALEQLGMSGAALRMHSLSSLFGTTVAALIDRFRSPLATPMPVELSNRRQFHVYARFNWPVWHGVGASLEQPSTDNGGAVACVPAATGASDMARSGGHPSAPATDTPSASGLIGGVRGQGASSTAAPERGGLASLSTGDGQIGGLVDKIRRVLNRDIPMLILGETGTGKELLARAIHQDSERARQPFVAVNCASIPETLIEAELFGYEEGAFTGARRKGAVGKIVQANGGTLFLDEIGDMPISLQAHLLRVLQERQVTPLGSAKAVSVDVMLVCATHRNLREMIEQKSFREDLYYRLNGLAVRLPPLRERTDLMALVERILERECPERRLRLSPEVLRLFQGYNWPGNVRQLFNVLRTACVMAADETVITRDHLSDDFIEDARRVSQRLSGDATGAGHGGGGSTPYGAGVGSGESSQAGKGVEAHVNAPFMPGQPGTAPPGWSPPGGAGSHIPAYWRGAASALDGQGHANHPPAMGEGHVMGTAGANSGLGGGGAADPAPDSLLSNPLAHSLEDIELQSIQRAVEAAGGNISVAAKRLGISRNTIYRKLRWKNSPGR